MAERQVKFGMYSFDQAVRMLYMKAIELNRKVKEREIIKMFPYKARWQKKNLFQ